MKKIPFAFICIVLFCSHAQSQSAEDDADVRSALISAFIERIKTDDRESIAASVHYPLRRPAPAPNIRNKEDFLAYYDKLFDEEFRSEIVNSDPNNNEDWGAVGWRGIIFKRGSLWLDYDGGLSAVKRISLKEKEYVDYLQKMDRLNLYPDLRDYTDNIYLLKTDKFIIRVDWVDRKAYRYAAWSSDKTMRDKPDIILSNGEHVFEGNVGNNYFKFINGDYVYEVRENIIGEVDTPPYELNVYKESEAEEEEIEYILHLPATEMFPYQ